MLTAFEPRWYRGDCHIHSVHSDGELTPEQLIAAARTARLDFIASTDHNTVAAHDTWDELTDEDLLVIIGAEVTTGTGHWLALGIERGQLIDWRYGASDGVIDRHLDRVHSAGGLCIAAHPHAPYPTGRFVYPYHGFDAVEVWNGLWTSDRPWNADNEAALLDWGRNLTADIRTGRWRPAIGNSDTHLVGQIGIPHTVVLAEGLSSDAILAGLRAGRSWIAESSAVDLTFEASSGDHTAGIGEWLNTDGRPAEVRIGVRGVSDGTVSVHTRQGVLHLESLSSKGSDELRWMAPADDPIFVRLEVRHSDGRMAALTNPILLA